MHVMYGEICMGKILMQFNFRIYLLVIIGKHRSSFITNDAMVMLLTFTSYTYAVVIYL